MKSGLIALGVAGLLFSSAAAHAQNADAPNWPSVRPGMDIGGGLANEPQQAQRDDARPALPPAVKRKDPPAQQRAYRPDGEPRP